jgi:peptidoglycan hydrolase-like protein with peptidoglycan-binding domain
MRIASPVRYVAVIAVAVTATWTLSSAVRSPSEVAVVPPRPVVLTAAVEARPLQAEVAGDGIVVLDQLSQIHAVASQANDLVVSSVPRAVGARLEWCLPLIELSDRPVFALQGAVPAYRDLKVGDVGEDVARLQDALRGCGFTIKDRAGSFQAGTRDAVSAMYKRAGYSIPRLPAAGPVAVEAVSPDAAAPPTAPPLVVSVPKAEIQFLVRDGTVSAVAALGDRVGEDPVMTVATAPPVFRATVAPMDVPRLERGQPVTVVIGARKVQVSLPPPPDAPVLDSTTGDAQYLVDLPLPDEGVPWPAGVSGHFTVTIGAASVQPYVVPVTALYARGDGTTYVLRAPDGADPLVVDVKVGDSLGGYTSITPLGELRAGDKVVIGASG